MILSPDLDDTRSKIADWLELLAVLSHRGAGDSDVAGLVRLASEDERGASEDDGDILESEILEPEFEETIARVADEISFREKCLGDSYPFQITIDPFSIDLKDKGTLSHASWVYLFLLLMTCQRDRLVALTEKIKKHVEEGRTLFHICASIGVAGVIRKATTVWFGWPRPDKSAFLTALAKLDRQIGENRALKTAPAGMPASPKDDGIDVIGWRRFGDRRGANIVMLCQAATGADWFNKTAVGYAESFRMWFEVPPYSKASTSTAIPSPAHHEVPENATGGFDVAVNTQLLRIQSHHGVILDRLRIVESVREVDGSADVGSVGGIDKLPRLKAWVDEALSAIRGG